MNPWDSYVSRMEGRGETRRDATLRREQRTLGKEFADSLSYHSMRIDDEERQVMVINSDNLNIKTLCSMPGEDLRHGALVDWADNHWLVIARDANNELYTKVTIQQCNFLAKWVSKDGEVVKRWSIVEDGTKYLTGEYGDKNFILVRGDSRVTMTLPKDRETVRLDRDSRFLIDNEDSPNVLAYRLTKPFKLGSCYGGNGVLSYVLTECATEDTDDLERRIPNYYRYFPRAGCEQTVPEPELPSVSEYPAEEQERPGDTKVDRGWF